MFKRLGRIFWKLSMLFILASAPDSALAVTVLDPRDSIASVYLIKKVPNATIDADGVGWS